MTSVKDFILFILLLKGEPVRCYNWYKGEIKGAQIYMKNSNVEMNLKIWFIHRTIINCIPAALSNLYFYGQEIFALISVFSKLTSISTELFK